ncbi:YcaO-like family protein [Rhizobium tumorigenes]|uniref:YcaO-like family protein n=1 Tax=Rhizobium tumorigenes TaxID=2041385 RepID=A0AAF1K3U5_9HYPH|nr:YcaO-like family protein [Rhizobium tumorigenes]WFR95263.1 YcaO-like family protein [Rhizobium tumorigenes]
MVSSSSDIESLRSAYSDRIRAPAETLRRISPLLQRYGITRLSRLTGLDNIGIPVWNAVSPNALSIVINQGKGITDIDAKVSAAMEALERAIAGAPDIPKPLRSWNWLTDAGALADRLDGLVAAGKADIAPDEPVEWVAGVDLLSGEPTYVPYEAAVLDRTKTGRFWQSSDGLASGNTYDEAVLHGLLERIERDAYVLWQVTSRERRHQCCIAASAFRDPVIDGLARRITEAGLKLVLFDITSDIGIPCYSALLGPADIATRRQPLYRDVSHGSGTHPDPIRAGIRAITEAAQSRLTFISGARDDIDPGCFTQPLPVETLECFAIDPALRPIEAVAISGGPAVLLSNSLDGLRRAGIGRAVAVTLSSPEVPITVAKIFVPELENPDGARKRKFGGRAISRVLGGA